MNGPKSASAGSPENIFAKSQPSNPSRATPTAAEIKPTKTAQNIRPRTAFVNPQRRQSKYNLLLRYV
jgi:hypothetical protein